MSSLLEEPVPQRNQAQPAQAGPKTGSFARTISGVHTDLVITKYSNATLIVITQLRKFGTVVQVGSERGRNQVEGGTRTVYSVNTLLGKDTEEVHLLARVLYEKLGLQQKPLILTVGVKDFTEEKIKPFVEFTIEKFKQI
jgi:hypothetical protein